nr:immunoglobulin heavy chain junction region [Macaca mulatta]MOX64588.1 immunoglobulin heavy chain junction region [Macaca mulatta]
CTAHYSGSYYIDYFAYW